MKIVYNIAGTWRSGGMERVLANKVNWLAANGHDVTVITTDQLGKEPFYPIDSRVRCIDLGINYEENNGGGLADKLLHFPAKQRRHKRALRRALAEIKPDITVSMFNNDAPIVASLKEAGKRVLEVHFSRDKRLQFRRSGLWALIDRFRNWQDGRTASRFDRFVVLTEEDKPCWGNLSNICVIPNSSPFKVDTPNALDSKIVFSAGRLGFQKGYERLIEAWSIAVKDCPGWQLVIAGEGEDKERLQQLIADLGVQDSVRLIGATRDIERCYRNASAVALSSRFECLPMILIEAQSFGLPIAAFACKCGPKDIVTEGVDGFLAPEGDIPALAQALHKLMSDDPLRHRLGSAAFASSHRYDENVVMSTWENLFTDLLKN